MTIKMTQSGKWLIADDGMWLCYKFAVEFARRVFLGKNRSADDYEEITDEEKQLREQALEE